MPVMTAPYLAKRKVYTRYEVKSANVWRRVTDSDLIARFNSARGDREEITMEGHRIRRTKDYGPFKIVDPATGHEENVGSNRTIAEDALRAYRQRRTNEALGIPTEQISNASKPITDIVSRFIQWGMTDQKWAEETGAEYKRHLMLLISTKRMATLADFTKTNVLEYMDGLVKRNGKPPAGGTKKRHWDAFRSFDSWLVERTYRPAKILGTPNFATAKESEPDALSVRECLKVAREARKRPLFAARIVGRGPNKGKAIKEVSPAREERLALLGQGRQVLYRTAFYCGLRRGDAAGLLVKHVEFNVVYEEKGVKKTLPATLFLPKEIQKTRRTTAIDNHYPIKSKRLAALLKAWIYASGRAGKPNEKLFDVPSKDRSAKYFRLDAAFAGIDTQNRQIEFRSLRAATQHWLLDRGVDLADRMRWLRHSKADTTIRSYDKTKANLQGLMRVVGN